MRVILGWAENTRLCNLIGCEADRGELPDDSEALSDLIRAVCFGNASRHFGIKL